MNPKKFELLGDPVSHSKSPAMHRAAYEALRLPHSYEARRVSALDLEACVEHLRNGNINGYNITVPHKIDILRFVDSVDESAKLVGAGNTLVLTSGGVVAYNTDLKALADEVDALLCSGPGGSLESALVLGSGGAARAAVGALALRLCAKQIVIRARAFATADTAASFRDELMARLGAQGSLATIVCEPLHPSKLDAHASVVIQATSAGMEGASPGHDVANAVAWDDVPKVAVALDVVYTPTRTPFLDQARARGLVAANGLGMLARQGAQAFELWLGIPPPLDVMRAAIM